MDQKGPGEQGSKLGKKVSLGSLCTPVPGLFSRDFEQFQGDPSWVVRHRKLKALFNIDPINLSYAGSWDTQPSLGALRFSLRPWNKASITIKHVVTFLLKEGLPVGL